MPLPYTPFGINFESLALVSLKIQRIISSRKPKNAHLSLQHSGAKRLELHEKIIEFYA